MEDRPESLGHQEPISSKLPPWNAHNVTYRSIARACWVALVAAASSSCPALLAIGALPLPRNPASPCFVAACSQPWSGCL